MKKSFEFSFNECSLHSSKEKYLNIYFAPNRNISDGKLLQETFREWISNL